MVRVDKAMKNERILEVLIVVLIIPLVSLLAGYFVSKDIIVPNISKTNDSNNFKEMVVKGVDLFEIILGSYSDFETAKYQEDLMRMKRVYSFVSKYSDKYLLIGGIFLDKEQAALFSSSLKSQGISSEVYLKRGPSLRIKYDKKLTSDMDDFTSKLQDFKQILDYIATLSYKAYDDKLERQELEELKRKVDSFKNGNGDFGKKEMTALVQKTTDIVDKITTDIEKIEISAALEDGNTFSLLQESLWQSCEEYNAFLKTIAVQNQ
ncbi:SPOR domain-containing protein [Thermoanaerobacter mathranii]|uniref:SPOR domain-containing protein n=1 Tax=Thermoanaerobacter mathranii TaxID=583357 RepID=UPI003AB07FAB